MKSFRETSLLLQSVFDQRKDCIDLAGSGVKIVNCDFRSDRQDVLPGAGRYICAGDGAEFVDDAATRPESGLVSHLDGLSIGDIDFRGNGEFRYSLFLPGGSAKARHVIFLLHGLNERHWHKYLPWASRLVELTGAAVLLLPIAFHMNRAPEEWSSPKSMRLVAEEREQHFPAVTASSFANAAISARLQAIPQRFFWSGMQTYHDLLQIIRAIRSGRHPFAMPDAQVDIFSYSIGSFLAQIILMADEEGLTSRSNLFIFCGGPTFDRMYPVSKYIMDSEALIALYAFFVEHLDNEFKRDPRLAHYFQEHLAGKYFRAMLSNRKLKELRESRLRELGVRVMAVALRKDEVIQPSEVLNTLNGDFRDIPIRVHIMDFPYGYTHVNPFPLQSRGAEEVEHAFAGIMDLAAGHLVHT